MTTTGKPADFGQDHHITAAELAHIRGPYLKRPNEHASGWDWARWADEVARAYPTAKLPLEEQVAKTAEMSQRRKRSPGGPPAP